MTRHQQQVLVVSELHSIYSNIQRILTTQGLHSTHIQTVDKASIAIEERQFHIIILDGRLPQITDFYQRLRHTLQLPVLVLTENNPTTNGSASVINKDDYVHLSFEATELIDAVRTVRQRCNGAKSKKTPPIHLGPVTINLDRFEATQDDEMIRLTRTEWALLEQLALHANKTMTHQMLLQRVWGDAYVDEHSYLHTYMRRLRRKLEPDPANPCYLVTDVGIGYRLMVSQNGFGDSHDSSEPARPENTSVRPHQLTAPLTSFLGRKHDLNELQKLLENPDMQLLTLTGPPGVGKTRLALHLVERIRDRFADGAHVISLAPLQDSSLVISTIAQALEIKEVPQQPIEETLKQALQNQEMLLLLDNFEQILDAAPALVELITAAPHLTILVTSRVSLRIAGEQEYLVAPLEMPDTTTIITKEIVEANPAVKLFVQRSQSTKADFALTEENTPAIVAICSRLDGLPLAIELAAARSKLFTPQTLLARLDERLRVLTQGLRGTPERHQTLRAALEWSYNLLSPEEQQVLMGLSVFAGGCTLEAATAVLNSDEGLVATLALPEQSTSSETQPIDVRLLTSFLDKIASLVDHSLIQVQTDSNGESRFVLLETIREYAWEKLGKSSQVTSLQQNLFNYYTNLVETANEEMKGSNQSAWLERIQYEYNNIRSMIRWAFSVQDYETISKISSAFWQFWIITGNISEGREIFENILTKQTNRTTYQYARALNIAGILADVQSDYHLAIIFYQKSLNIMHQIGETSPLGHIFCNLGLVYFYQGDCSQAALAFEDSLKWYKKSKNKAGVANVFNNIGLLFTEQGEYTEADQAFRESLQIRQDEKDHLNARVSIYNIGRLKMITGMYEEAVETFRYVLEQERAFSNKIGIINASNSIGRCFIYQENTPQAIVYLQESLDLSQAIGEQDGVAKSLYNFGLIAIYQNEVNRAIQLMSESLLIRQKIKDKYGIAESLEGLGAVTMFYNPYVSLCLCSAASLLRNSIGAPIPPVDKPHYEQTLTFTREHLNEATWQQAWEAGQKMSLEEAIDYALEHVLVDERVVGEEARQETDH